jgi:SAM-dependent methyltransferase
LGTLENANPQSKSIRYIFYKAAEACISLAKIRQFDELFSQANDVLELGGGQLWASCIVKRSYPSAHVTGTDISPFAIASAFKWEQIFQVEIDDKKACASFHTPFADRSFDLIFTFAAAHQFRRHRLTFAEIARLLRPGGTALYLHEPGCQQYIYGAALKRVNSKRAEAPEDVLRYRHLERLGLENDLVIETRFAPTLQNRGPRETLYYIILRQFPLLQNILPCTVDLIIRKNVGINRGGRTL